LKAGILSYGVYVPFYRLARAEMGKAWGIPSLPGERAVANRDEDSLTIAVEAGPPSRVRPPRASGVLLYRSSRPAPSLAN